VFATLSGISAAVNELLQTSIIALPMRRWPQPDASLRSKRTVVALQRAGTGQRRLIWQVDPEESDTRHSVSSETCVSWWKTAVEIIRERPPSIQRVRLTRLLIPAGMRSRVSSYVAVPGDAQLVLLFGSFRSVRHRLQRTVAGEVWFFRFEWAVVVASTCPIKRSELWRIRAHCWAGWPGSSCERLGLPIEIAVRMHRVRQPPFAGCHGSVMQMAHADATWIHGVSASSLTTIA